MYYPIKIAMFSKNTLPHWNRTLLAIAVFLRITFTFCQTPVVVTEVGAGIGNILGDEHKLGKAEIHFNVLKEYPFGKLGVDFALGGNFIPGDNTILENDVEILASNDSQFGTIALFYRLPIGKHLFLEPRLGYSSLFANVFFESERRRIREPNFTAGFGIGGTFQNVTLSLRYQNLGKTAAFNETVNTTTIQSNSDSVSVILLRLSYGFDVSKLFKK